MFLKIEVCSTFYSYEQIEKIVSFYMAYNMSKSKFKQSRFTKSASNHRSLVYILEIQRLFHILYCAMKAQHHAGRPVHLALRHPYAV